MSVIKDTEMLKARLYDAEQTTLIAFALHSYFISPAKREPNVDKLRFYNSVFIHTVLGEMEDDKATIAEDVRKQVEKLRQDIKYANPDLDWS